MKNMSTQKTTKTFKDAFEDVLEEAIGPGAYIPAGINAITSDPMHPSGRKGQNPPYSVYSYSSRMGSDVAYGTGILSQDRRETDAPKIAPYPLQTVTDYLSNCYTDLKNIQFEVKQAIQNPITSPAQKSELSRINGELQKMIDNFKDTSDALLKITL
jgi:hypothetical protein